MRSAQASVSILIPAYNERFFPEALASALGQAWPALEIVVCDDSSGSSIEAAVRAAADARVRYRRNPARLGFAGNFTECFRQAQGEYVKFLNDDDRLRPDCVAGLAAGLLDPAVTLATSRRFVIGESGERLPDVRATTPLALVSAFLPGLELGNLVLVNSLNLIGEPTTAMFRRADLAPEGDDIFRWGGREYHCLADLSLWLRLLARGRAYYSAAGLSEYRRHGGQEQRRADVLLGCLFERHHLAHQARASGYLAAPGQWRAALTAIRAGVAIADPAQAPGELRDFLRAIDDEIAGAPSAG